MPTFTENETATVQATPEVATPQRVDQSELQVFRKGGRVNVYTSCLPIKVTLRRCGNTKKVDSHTVDDSITVEADKSRLTVNKKIFHGPEMDAVKSHDGLIRAYLQSRALPAGDLGKGTYLIPISLIREVDQTVQTMLAERQRLIDMAVEAYPRMREEGIERLGVLANNIDYPSAEEFRGKYTHDFQYFEKRAPGKDNQELVEAGLNDVIDREQQKFSRRSDEILDMAAQALRAQFLEMVETLHAQLGTKEDGKRRRLFQGTFDKLTDFVTIFRNLNLAGDDELEAFANRTREILEGHDFEAVKKHDSFRAQLRAQLDQVVAGAKEQIGQQGARGRIDLNDLDEEEAG